MAEVGCQHRKLRIEVGSLLAPPQQGMDGKIVPLIPHAELEALFRVTDYSAYGSPGPAIHGEYAGWGHANTE